MSRTLSERLRWMLADFEKMGVNEMTANLPAIRDAIALARRVEGAAKVTVVNDVIGPHIDLATWHAADSWPGTYALVPVEGGA